MDEKALNELLECSVCLDQLDHTSKVLPCQHTFCRRCLEEIVSTKRELRCPECRTLVEIRVEDLPSNILLIRLLEGLKNANNPLLATQSSGVARLQFQSHRNDGLTSVSHPDGNPTGNAGSQENSNQVIQPSAKALYNYDTKEQGDLAFRKGDIIVLKKQIDMNWYQGELNGHTGFFPSTYVEVLTALPSLIPQCKALYDFDMKDENEKDCLTFLKDEIVTVIRRVDDNWIEGRKGDRIGIFPISFVELNDAAKCLVNAKTSSKPSVIVTTANVSAPSRPSESTAPKVSGNQALLSVDIGASKRHSLTSIATQNPPVPAHNQRRSMELISPILVPSSITPLSPPFHRPLHPTPPSSSQGCVVMASSHQDSSVSMSHTTQTPASVPTTSSSSSSSSTCNGSSSTGHRKTDGVISQNMFAAAPGTLISYVAMYNYKPQKEDEVELKKGEYYTVHVKCQDGWFKGTSLKSGQSGVFPGNYVQLVRSSIPMKPVNSNVLNIRAKASVGVSSPSNPPSSTGSGEPPPIPPLCVHKQSSESHSGNIPHVPVRQTGPPLMPRMGKAAVVAAANQAASVVTQSSKSSSHGSNLTSIGKHPHITSSSHSSSHSSSSKSSKGNHKQESTNTHSGHSSKKSSSNSVMAQSNPAYSNNALVVKPHPSSLPSNIVISAPPNVSVAGAVGGAATRSSASSSSPSRDKDKKDKNKEKLSLVKRLTPGKTKRSKSHDNETVAAASGVNVADVGISHMRSGSFPSEGSAPQTDSSPHKKSGSLDSTSASSALAKPTKPKTIKEKFRCIVPYPPQSEVELELKLGDVVFVHKKRDDGWFRGTLQRSGNTGLFPGSFVEKYD